MSSYTLKFKRGHLGSFRVTLNDLLIGTIHPVQGGFAFFPKGGGRVMEKPYLTLEDCKGALEASKGSLGVYYGI